MGAGDQGFSAPELATLHLLTPPTLVSGRSYPLRPLPDFPDALAVPTAQGTFWFANEQQPERSSYDLCYPRGIITHLQEPDGRIWQIAPLGNLSADCGFWAPAPTPFTTGESFSVPGAFQVSASDAATLTFTWLDTTPPTKPVPHFYGTRAFSLSGGKDQGSGLARFEVRQGGKLRTPDSDGSFDFPEGKAGTATVVAVDNAGNRSAAVALRFTRMGAIHIIR